MRLPVASIANRGSNVLGGAESATTTWPELTEAFLPLQPRITVGPKNNIAENIALATLDKGERPCND